MTFKDLSFNKKLEHIWEYYKWVIIGILFVMVAGTSMVYAMFVKPQPVNYAGISIYGSHIDMEDINSMTNDINTALGLTEPNTVTVTDYFFQKNDEVFNVDMERKFVTYLFSLEMHLITAVQPDMEVFIDSEYVAPLTEYFTADEIKALDEQGRVLYAKDPLDSQEKPFAVNIDNSRLLDKYSVYKDNDSEDGVYMGIVPVKGFEDNTMAVAREIMK